MLMCPFLYALYKFFFGDISFERPLRLSLYSLRVCQSHGDYMLIKCQLYVDYMSIIWQVPSLTSISLYGACEITSVTKEDEIRIIFMQ